MTTLFRILSNLIALLALVVGLVAVAILALAWAVDPDLD